MRGLLLQTLACDAGSCLGQGSGLQPAVTTRTLPPGQRGVNNEEAGVHAASQDFQTASALVIGILRGVMEAHLDSFGVDVFPNKQSLR